MQDRHPLAALLDLVLPTPCAGCGEPAARWCAACARCFARPGVRPVPGLPPVLVLARYVGPARAGVIAYKERGRRDLAVPLGRAVARALRALPALGGPLAPTARAAAAGLTLVPAPSRAAAARARGGDHMVRLARSAARAAGPGVDALPALALHRRARDSVGLDAAVRAENLARHLRGRPRALATLRDRPGAVVLLDDVLTTGATASAAVGLLARAGVGVDAVVVLTAPARAGRRGGRPGRARRHADAAPRRRHLPPGPDPGLR